jgi:hypothetical protein
LYRRTLAKAIRRIESPRVIRLIQNPVCTSVMDMWQVDSKVLFFETFLSLMNVARDQADTNARRSETSRLRSGLESIYCRDYFLRMK